MALSDLAVFSEFAQTSMTELHDQQVKLFNGATRGGLVLQSGSHMGDYSETAIWAKISGLVRRRNAYGTGAVAEKILQQLVETSVKVGSGTPPVRIDPGMLKWIQKSPEEAGVVIGRQLAQDNIADMLNIGVSIFVTAIGAVSAVVYDHSATGVMSLSALNKGAAKFGDRSGSLVSWVLHSKSAFDIYGEALLNTNKLFTFGNVRVIEDGFGRPLIITDSPALVNATPTPDQYHALGLTQGALMVSQNNDFTDNIETSNGSENIIRTYQAEWSYNVGITGFAWDKTNGGASPTAAALGTATNWDRYATSDKDLAGVLVIAQ